jgi:hypothetical protein
MTKGSEPNGNKHSPNLVCCTKVTRKNKVYRVYNHTILLTHEINNFISSTEIWFFLKCSAHILSSVCSLFKVGNTNRSLEYSFLKRQHQFQFALFPDYGIIAIMPYYYAQFFFILIQRQTFFSKCCLHNNHSFISSTLCYASCSGVKAVKWTAAFFSNSGTFCIPGMTHLGLWIRGSIQGMSLPIRDGWQACLYVRKLLSCSPCWWW